MEEGRSLIATDAHFWGVLLSKKGDWYGDKVIPFYCKNCGYIELYKGMKERRNSHEQGKTWPANNVKQLFTSIIPSDHPIWTMTAHFSTG
jgi:predicted nucleic-acid-binding Zn-ribbon protein